MKLANPIIKSGTYKGKQWFIVQTNSGQMGKAVDYQMVVPGVFKSDYFTSLEKWSITRELCQAKMFICEVV